MAVVVVAASADRWTDIGSAFGRRGNDPSWCWCQRFLRSRDADASTPRPDNRDALRREVASAAVPPGLLAYVGDQPAGWARVGPRSTFPLVVENRALARTLTDAPGTWWITCFAIHPRFRRSGVGSALVRAAVGFARDHGATAVEGHPVDTDALRATQVGGSALFTGTAAMFVAAGFVEVARTYPSRPLMRLQL